MGTMIQALKLDEAGYRGRRFADWKQDVRGNNDLLVLSQADVVRDLHLAYFRAGADIVSTNTFSSTAIAQADYGMQDAGGRTQPRGRAARARSRRHRRGRGRAAALRGRRHGADQPHRLDLARREQSGLPRGHLRSAARSLCRAGERPDRRRRRYPADRDHLRYAQRQGRALCHRRAS